MILHPLHLQVKGPGDIASFQLTCKGLAYGLLACQWGLIGLAWLTVAVTAYAHGLLFLQGYVWMRQRYLSRALRVLH